MENSLLNRIPIAAAELRAIRDANGEISDFEWLEANAFGALMIGVPYAQLTGARLSAMTSTFRQDRFFDLMKEAIETQKHVEAVTPVGYNEGPLSGRSFYVGLAPQGDTLALAAHEATKLRTGTEELSEHFLLFRELVNNSALGATISNAAGEIIYANPAFLDALGWSLDDVVGQNLLRYVHPSDRENATQFANNIIKNGTQRTEHSDVLYRKRDGTKLLNACIASAMTSPVNDTICYVTQYRDAGEERESAVKLETAMQKAEAASKMKSEFLANMSHEIRTPLNGVIGMAQVLARGDLTKDQTEQVDTIIDSGSALMTLLNDILDLSKIEAGQLEISPITCDVRHKLGRVHQLFEPIADEKRIAFQFFVDPSVPAVLDMDPVRVRQCLSNLISNAMKFTDQGSVTTMVTAEPRADGQHMVKIFVSDTGVGIPDDKQDQIFADFQQADGSTTRKYGGTGLGLSVTRSLARMMGGEITVSSQLGKGSVFILTFMAGDSSADISFDDAQLHKLDTAIEALDMPAKPMLAASISAHPPAPEVEPQVPVSNTPAAAPLSAKRFQLGNQKILVVDDNMINRRVLCALLDEYEFEFTEAENGQIALDLMAETKFDLVLLDIHMPVLDGIETIKAIRRSSTLKDTQVIALTANAMTGDAEKYLAYGMDGYVSKPVSYDELMTEINRVLQNTRNMRAAG